MEKICEICGVSFKKPTSNCLKYWETRRFCSTKCMGKWQVGRLHTEEHKRKIRESCKGLINAGSFKRKMPLGQKCSFCDRDAYYAKPKPSCSMHYKRHWYKYYRKDIDGKKTLYHRFVMEQFIGRKLTKDEVVHHINGDRMDNRIENLELMERINHLKMHAKLRK